MNKVSQGVFSGKWKSREEIPESIHNGYPYNHHTSYIINEGLIDNDEDVINILKSFEKKDISVFEFGSSASLKFLFVLQKHCDKIIKEFNVIDRPNVCEVIRERYDQKIVKCFDSIQKVSQNISVDLLYVKGATQYTEHQKELYDLMINLRASLIILNRTFVTDEEGFWTNQEYNGCFIPCYVKNYDELIKFFERNGYEVINESIDHEYNYPDRISKNVMFRRL